MLWARETETGPFDTPERRAALEARLGEVIAGIGEESVRRHYRADFGDRLRALFQPASQRPPREQRRPWSDRGGRFDRRRGTQPQAAGAPYVVMSPQLAASPVHRGHRGAVPRREALILQAVLNHPWLLHDHLEDLAAIEFRHSETEKLKAALVDIFAHAHAPDTHGMRAELDRRGLTVALARIEKAITTPSVWGARADAGPEDVLMTWRQLIALHRQWHSLLRELKDAELALGRDSTEANYSWLQDVKARLSVLDGTEALIEGFGASSGRAAPVL
jgi:DNA primase